MNFKLFLAYSSTFLLMLKIFLPDIHAIVNAPNDINSSVKAVSKKVSDYDNDGYDDFEDLDDDNDGILDKDEFDGRDPSLDEDKDGIPNFRDPDFCELGASGLCKSLDLDEDGIPNHLDTDSDNDGIPDNFEAQSTQNYIEPSGKILENGTDSSYLNGIIPIDTDYDKIPDFIDIDSDNDGILDKVEIKHNLSNVQNDMDADGVIDYRDLFNINPPSEASIYFDGIDDYIEGPQLMSKYNQSNTQGVTLMCWVKNDLDDNDTTSRFLFGEENAITLKSKGSTLEVTGVFKTSVGGFHISNFSKTNGLKKGIWRHVSLTVDFANNEASIFIDGKWVHMRNLGYPGDNDIAGFYSELTRTLEKFMLGRQSERSELYYKGSIDEVRVFDKVLTEKEIQEIVFQEIENNNGLLKGKLTPNQVGDTTWDDLVLYYPISDVKHAKMNDKSNQGNFAIIHNITSLNTQTAPMPFVTVADGAWSNKETWLHGEFWALPWDGKTENMSYSDEHYTWGIYHIRNNVSLSSSMNHLDVVRPSEKLEALAVIVDEKNHFDNSTVALIIDGISQNLQLKVSNYLELSGNVKLKNNAQLIPVKASALEVSFNGDFEDE